MITIHKKAMIFAGGYNGAPACHFNKSSSKSTQSSTQQSVGVQGGGSGGTLGVGAGNSGTNVSVGAGAVSAINKGAGTINVTTDNAANSEAAFSTIDHLISMEAAAQGNVPAQPTASTPTIISYGAPGGNGYAGGSAPSTSGSIDWVTIAVVGGGVLSLIVFFKSKGQSA